MNRFNSTLPQLPRPVAVSSHHHSFTSDRKCYSGKEYLTRSDELPTDERHRKRRNRAERRNEEHLDSVRFYATSLGNGDVVNDVTDVSRRRVFLDASVAGAADDVDVEPDEEVEIFRGERFLYRSFLRMSLKFSSDEPPVSWADTPRPDFRDLSRLAAIVWNVLTLADALVVWRRITWTYAGACRMWQKLSSGDVASARTTSCCVDCCGHNNGSLYADTGSMPPVEQCRCQCRPDTQRLAASNCRSTCDNQLCDVAEPDMDGVKPPTSSRHRIGRCVCKFGIFVRCVQPILRDGLFPVAALTAGAVVVWLVFAGTATSALVAVLQPLFQVAAVAASVTTANRIGSHDNQFAGYADSALRIVGGRDHSVTQSSVTQMSMLQSLIVSINAGKCELTTIIFEFDKQTEDILCVVYIRPINYL